MPRLNYVLLTLRAFCNLIYYDLYNALFGFSGIHKQVSARRAARCTPNADMETVVCDAVALAACFYWRPVLCLQRSVAATLLLRRHGIDGRLVIGYRPSPFFSHAWVEVDGRVVNDSPGYKERLQVLCTA